MSGECLFTHLGFKNTKLPINIIYEHHPMASDDKAIIVFGQDITKIPCFRNSFLYGISSGLGGGLFYFMISSKPMMASHCGMGVFTVVTLGYWAHCRYNYSKTRFEMLRLQRLLQQQAIYEGTALEKEIDEEMKQKGVEV